MGANQAVVLDFQMDDRTLDSAEPLEVTAFWDPEAKVWVALSDELPGLVAEADSMNELVPELDRIIPALIEANDVTRLRNRHVRYHLVAHIENSIDAPSLA